MKGNLSSESQWYGTVSIYENMQNCHNIWNHFCQNYPVLILTFLFNYQHKLSNNFKKINMYVKFIIREWKVFMFSNIGNWDCIIISIMFQAITKKKIKLNWIIKVTNL